ncbi:MAG: WD40/YVTN/BNR-like repeat-containing protein [Candidatus Limnocylindrales bacterium]
MTDRWRRRSAAVLLAAWLAAACAPVPPTASPATSVASVASPVASARWIAARVDQPAAIEAAPTSSPGFCSPCHPVIGTYIDSIVSFRGGFLALGYDQPPSHAAAWASTDAAAWHRLTSLPAPEGSSVIAAVAPGGAAILAVGGSGGAGAVWRSDDGSSWNLTALPAPPTGATELLTAVAATGGGYVAGGYEESATAVKTASFWRSADGVAWVRANAELPAGASEVTGIAAVGPASIVAVGIAGDERRGTAAVWRSTDAGTSWQSVASPTFASGRMLAVAASGTGLVAVGERQDQTGAAAWFSTDGSTWVSSSGSGLDNGGLEMVMTAVAVEGAGFVAAGWRSDAGNGSAVVWSSGDGRTWIHLPQDVSFSGAGLASVLASPRLLVGGTMGWPDTHAAQVWVGLGG